MKNLKGRKSLKFLFVIVAALCFAQITKANSIYDQVNGGTEASTSCAALQYGCGVVVGRYQNLPSNFVLSSATVNNGYNCTGNFNLRTTVWDNNSRSGSPIYQGTQSEICFNATAAYETQFITPLTINTGQMSIEFASESVSGGVTITNAGTNIQPFTDSFDGSSNVAAGFGFPTYPQLFFNGNPFGDAIFKFQNPPFSDNLVSPDFQNWWLYTDFSSSFANTGFYFTVSYGTSTPYGVGFDSLKNVLGVVPLDATATPKSYLLAKAATTTPGNYEAIATLYNQVDATMAQTSILHFTISTSTGQILNVPNNNTAVGGTQVQNCGPTQFNVFGADFGQGACNLVRFLVIPDQSVLNNFSGLTTTFSQKIPFSYFYDIASTTENLSTTGSNSPVTSFDLVASTTSLHLTYSPFSSTTAASYMGQSLYDFYQTMMKYAVLASFGFFVFFRVKGLINPK